MKKAVISWGRFNPPTVGHEKLVQKVITVAKRERGEPRVYLTHTQNATKDPLSYRDKISFATKAFGSIVKVSASRTIIQLMVELQKAGFKEVVASFSKICCAYFELPTPMGSVNSKIAISYKYLDVGD